MIQFYTSMSMSIDDIAKAAEPTALEFTEGSMDRFVVVRRSLSEQESLKFVEEVRGIWGKRPVAIVSHNEYILLSLLQAVRWKRMKPEDLQVFEVSQYQPPVLVDVRSDEPTGRDTGEVSVERRPVRPDGDFDEEWSEGFYEARAWMLFDDPPD